MMKANAIKGTKSIIGRLRAVLALATLTAGCASTAGHAEGGNKQTSNIHSSADSGYQATRRAAAVGQATVLYTKTMYVDPIIRPVSYFSSLSSLLLKSTGGVLRRVSLSTIQMPALQGPIPDVSNAEPMDLEAWEKELDRASGTRQSSGTIEFLVDGEEYFTRLEESVEQATDSIDMRTYIFDNDEYAMSVAQQLKERSDELRVRIMLDTLGNLIATQSDPETLPDHHKPPLSISMHLRDDSGIKVRNLSNPWFTGDHTKTTIIDKKVAFVGGMNIGREYRYDWHDLMMEVHGPVVDQLQHDSDKAWARAGIFGEVANFLKFLDGKEAQAERGGYPLRILKTRNFDSQIYRAQLAAIRSARSYIMIENAYFSDDQIMYELARARRRGVDVRVIMPTSGNHGPVHASNQVAINQMIEHGIRVYLYPGMSHIKAAIFDGWACVGSANFDKLSLQINKELNLATSDPNTVKTLIDRVFLPDMMISVEIDKPVETTMTAKLAEVVVDEFL
jgi:cardiolipin synthase